MNDTQTLKEFYPTPPELIAKMLKGIVPHSDMYVLEPSAGKGDIALFWERALDYINDRWRWREIDPDNEMDTNEMIEKIIDTSVVNSFKDNREHYINHNYLKKIDCIEINPVLRDILKGRGLRVVDFDFLIYNGDKKYDLILMNPPFSNGDEHLLKAIEIGEKYGSLIVCILNAETIRNPFSNKRKSLLQKLNNYEADVEFCQAAEKGKRFVIKECWKNKDTLKSISDFCEVSNNCCNKDCCKDCVFSIDINMYQQLGCWYKPSSDNSTTTVPIVHDTHSCPRFVAESDVIEAFEGDLFFDHPQAQKILCISYNPDSTTEGQFVYAYYSYDDILKAANCKSVDDFFDRLNEKAYQELFDKGTEEFNQIISYYVLKHKRPDFSGYTIETAYHMIDVAKKETNENE